jgi:SAM-dependent methyltransferase
VAESFGSNAERYDRTRPSYPDALVDRIVAASPGPDVLDVGCGTGIATRQFIAAGCRVLGIDPDVRMAELARDRGVEVEIAKFEAWDPKGRQFDAVIAAQAWHWVDPVAGSAKAAQVLLPGGRLAVFWNGMQPPPDLFRAFGEVYGRVQTGLPFNPYARPVLDSYLIMSGTAADGMRQAGAFAEPEQWRFDWDHVYSRDELLEQVPTLGGHSQIPSERLRELLDGMGAAIDAAGGSVQAHYTAVVVTALRTSAG